MIGAFLSPKTWSLALSEGIFPVGTVAAWLPAEGELPRPLQKMPKAISAPAMIMATGIESDVLDCSFIESEF